MNYVSLWEDPSDQTFYAFGGEVSGISLPGVKVIPPNGLWQFTPDGNSGSWAEVGISGNSIFPDLVRPAAAIGAAGNGVGVLLGGYNHFIPVPGIVSYNMSSKLWANNSATGFSTYGTAMYGQMQRIPYGDNGLFMVIGGETSNNILWVDNGSDLLSFEAVYIYDPTSNSWHNQTTSGDVPESRDRFCSVGIAGDNGTFEIFIFGGE